MTTVKTNMKQFHALIDDRHSTMINAQDLVTAAMIAMKHSNAPLEKCHTSINPERTSLSVMCDDEDVLFVEQADDE